MSDVFSQHEQNAIDCKLIFNMITMKECYTIISLKKVVKLFQNEKQKMRVLFINRSKRNVSQLLYSQRKPRRLCTCITCLCILFLSLEKLL